MVGEVVAPRHCQATIFGGRRPQPYGRRRGLRGKAPDRPRKRGSLQPE